GFCDHNPANVTQYIQGGETIVGSLINGTNGQVPPTTGIFDTTHNDNPFLNWNQVYVPYCTGDVHFGTKTNVVVDATNMPTPQQFVGHLNMQKFVARLVPTFPTAERVVLTGASAGGFGAGLNFGMVQDSFGSIPVTVLDDSGPPFRGAGIATCLQ